MGAQRRHTSSVKNNVAEIATHKGTPGGTHGTRVVAGIELRVHTGLRTQYCQISSVNGTLAGAAIRKDADESGR